MLDNGLFSPVTDHILQYHLLHTESVHAQRSKQAHITAFTRTENVAQQGRRAYHVRKPC